MYDIEGTAKKGDYLYAKVPNHPNANKNGYVLLHRAIMENSIGRYLTKDEVVHHKDHNKFNNDISNLQLMTHKEHSLLHALENAKTKLYDIVELKCPSCGKIFCKPITTTHLQDNNRIMDTCCRSCCSKIGRTKSTDPKEYNRRVQENVVDVFKARKLTKYIYMKETSFI